MEMTTSQLIDMAMEEFFSLSAVVADTPNILFRGMTQPTVIVNKNAQPYKQDPMVDDLDSFKITTFEDAENTISYKYIKNIVNLNKTDGGYF